MKKGAGRLKHNNRVCTPKNVDKDRTKYNVYIKQQSLQEAYDECFGQAVKDYNAKQKRKDRKISDYHEHLFGVSASSTTAQNTLVNSDKAHSFYEEIIQIGDMDDTGIKSNPRYAELAKQAIIDHIKGNPKLGIKSFEERNPQFHVFNATVHMDEKTPHAHLDYIPVAYGYQRGLQAQNGYEKALKQMGYSSFEEWRTRERDTFRVICEHYGLDPISKDEEKNRGYDYTPEQYRRKMREADKKASETIQNARREADRMISEANGILANARKKANEIDQKNLEADRFMDSLQETAKQIDRVVKVKTEIHRGKQNDTYKQRVAALANWITDDDENEMTAKRSQTESYKQY